MPPDDVIVGAVWTPFGGGTLLRVVGKEVRNSCARFIRRTRRRGIAEIPINSRKNRR
jgi:hypothetical protein